MDKLCSVAGTCISFASKIVKEYADFVPILGKVAQGAVVLNTNKLHYGMLLKEASYANKLLVSFRKLVEYMEIVEKEVGFKVCSLDTARKFDKDFTELLTYYDTTTFNKTQQVISPDWYRTQLQVYLSYLMNITTTIQGESARILSENALVELIKNPEEKAAAREKLVRNYSC